MTEKAVTTNVVSAIMRFYQAQIKKAEEDGTVL